MMNKFLLPTLMLALVGCGKYPRLETIESVREGNKDIQKQNAQGALEQYLKGLRFDPFLPELHLNVGLSFEILQQNEKAMSSYKEAERIAAAVNNKELEFAAIFNQAQMLAKAKKIDKAIAMYQKALDINPTSMETKVNIELLTQQQQGQGEGENQDQQNQDQQNQDQKNQDQQKKDQGKEGEQKDDKKDQDKDGKEKEDKPKEFQKSQKYKPRPFNGKDLSEADVKKILGELKQQEEKIRAEYNRKEVKEQPRDKDW